MLKDNLSSEAVDRDIVVIYIEQLSAVCVTVGVE